MSADDDPYEVDDLIDDFSRERLMRNGVPDATTAAGRERCRDVLHEVLGHRMDDAELSQSPLGPRWTDRFAVSLRTPVDVEHLTRAGWLRIDGLLPGARDSPGSLGTWAVVENGRVLASVRLGCGRLHERPAQTVLERCRERGEVRLREVLELRELRRAGADLPEVSAVLTAASEIESGLGGRLLAPWATGRVAQAPVTLRQHGLRRSRRLVTAISGVDGSGKTTLRAAIEQDLHRAGVLVSTVWVRPGMGLGPLVRLASFAKQTLGEDPAPGIRVMSRSGAGTSTPRSRRGVVGWSWATLVCVSFIVGVWRQHAASKGVVLYDRHLVDALATLDFAYEGVDLRFQRAMVRRLLPRANVSFYLEVPAEVSVARKPDELVGANAVSRQLRAYDHWLDRLPAGHRLDATLPAGRLATDALRLLVVGNVRPPRRPRSRPEP